MKTMNRLVGALSVVLTVLVCLGLESTTANRAIAETEIVVFAAASTTNAITKICKMYEARQLGRATLSFASSSTLAKQIENGAPADIYISANKKWMDYLEEKHLIAPRSRFDLFSNRIVLIAPVDSALKRIDVTPGFSLITALGRDGRLSMGDPDHVPAGIYGKKALESLGSWDPVKDRLAPMRDVRSALVLVERGETPIGLVYATDAAISRKVHIVGTFPVNSHPPIVYPVAIVANGKISEAQKFLTFLKSPDSQEVFQEYGFDVK